MVGAPGTENPIVTTGPGGGAFVYLRQLNGTSSISQFLQPPTPALDNAFGYALDLTSTQLVVGAPFTDAGVASRGRVYTYPRTGKALARRRPLISVWQLTTMRD